jgi:hypothetical protein
VVQLGHLFWIKTSPGIGTANAYGAAVTNNGNTNATITLVVFTIAPSTLYYNCEIHSGMAGVINITN